MPIDWNDGSFKDKVSQNVRQNLHKAGLFLAGQIQQSINVGNATGRNPSAPGEPPHKVSGRLFSSITSTEPFDVDATTIRVLVGTNLEYGPRLEFGFYGTDSKGHNVNQPARPFIRPGFANNLAACARIALTGSR